MKFRRAASLAVYLEDNKVVLHNFLTHNRISCSTAALDFLAKLDTWHTPRKLLGYFPGVSGASLADEVSRLVKHNVIVVEGTPQAEADATYRSEWLWGVSAGLFHFSIRSTRFATGKRAQEYMRKRRAWRISPKLIESNSKRPLTRLPRVDLDQEPLALMRRRRSERQFDGKPVALSVLSDCLFAGNGIVEIRDAGVYGRLPISMTPSGGARNPFELYVYAQHIEGLKPGFYHYDSLKHNLGLVRAGRVNVPDMLGTQKWPAKAAAIVFLVAHFPRSMWKYHMPMAYRVVVMEGGFIGQNIALMATHHGLSAIPSGALNTTLVESYLGNPAVESGVVLSLNIGRPKANAAKRPGRAD